MSEWTKIGEEMPHACVHVLRTDGEEKPSTIIQMLNGIADEICDDYCKWPEKCKSDIRLMKHCHECPLNRMGV